jgi:hypothetical protein
MVLHLRDHNRIAGLQNRTAIGVGDEVDGFGGIAGKDDLVARGGVEKVGNFVAHAFIRVGGAFGHPVQAAMDVGVLRFHRVNHRIDHRAGFLRGGGGVQKHQLLAVHQGAENRKVPPNGFNI